MGLNAGELLTLEDCYDLAGKQNTMLQQSSNNLESSRINTKSAYSALYPHASFSLNSGFSGSEIIPDGSGSFTYSTSINQTLFTPGLLPNLKMAKLAERNSEITLSSTRDQLKTLVATLYYRILSSKALIRVYDENIRLADENIKKIRTMYELGTRTESDVLKSEVQKGNFVTQLVNEEQNMKALKNNLNVTLGRAPGTKLELAEAAPSTGSEDGNLPEINKAMELLRQNNPDLKQAELQKEVSRLSLSSAKQGYFPSVGASYSHSGSDPKSVFDGSSVSLSASINLFNRFQTRNNIQKERINVKQAAIGLLEVLHQKDRELSDFYTQNSTIDKLIRINETTLESSQRDLDIVTQQYQIGSTTILDQMNAQLSVLNAQSNLVKLKYSKKIIESQINQLIGK